MRSNSGSGKSSNNLHDPTLKEADEEKGKSGEARIDGNPERDRQQAQTRR